MDRLTKIKHLLFWSAASAFTVLAPGWFWSEGYWLLTQGRASRILETEVQSDIYSIWQLLFYLTVNGTAHFLQSLLAISVLASTSPVTYSIASLMKRVAVIVCAVIWFRQPIGWVQAAGIVLTFYGLWLYDKAKGEVHRGERVVAKMLSERGGLVLPFVRGTAVGGIRGGSK